MTRTVGFKALMRLLSQLVLVLVPLYRYLANGTETNYLYVQDYFENRGQDCHLTMIIFDIV